MPVEDCFSKKWLSYNFSRIRTDKNWIKPIEDTYAIRYNDSHLSDLVLRTGIGPQYIAKSFKAPVKLLNIKHEYIKKADT